YDYYEYDNIDHYCWLIETSGYECYWSSENRWSFANNGHFIDVETDAALGYVYVTPFAENSAFETGYYYGDGDTYYNTDIPTFSSVTDIEASSVKDSDYGAVMFTYVCTEREYRAYIRELEIVGFVDVSGDYTMLESPTNKYVLVLRNDSSVSVVAFDAYETYLNTGVPNYTAVTGAECLFWNTDEDGNHIYYYSFISLFTSEMTTYDAYLSDAGYESFYEETTEEYAVMYMTNGSSVVSIMSLLIDGTFYIAITPWMTENIS
ncbi:MAG: hypothetical protein LUG52_07820, partial [Clostridia bacterium]|nr:hypothetical protein [Clostridia bacterium]